MCRVGVKERKPGRVPACMEKNGAMETKFNAFSVNLFVFVCLFNSFLQVYRFKISIS